MPQKWPTEFSKGFSRNIQKSGMAFRRSTSAATFFLLFLIGVQVCL
jgi:hypothetical protein